MPEPARCTIPLDLPLDRLLGMAAALGLAPEVSAEGLALDVEIGRIEARARGTGSLLTLTAPDAESLAHLREEVAEAMAGAAREAPTGAGAPPTNLALGRVLSCERISASFRRLRLEGEFGRFREGGLHLRLIFGPEGAGWPHLDAAGATLWPGGIDAWHRPPYTTRALDPAGTWIDIDILLHEGGRVTEWSEGLRPGDEVAVTGPGGSRVPQAGWLGCVGDGTAMPVILRMVEAVPEGTGGQAIIVVPDASDIQAARVPSTMRLDWLLERDAPPLLDLLAEMRIPSADRHVFLAGERRQAVAARERLAAQGLARGEFLAAAYWTEGWVPPPEQWRPPPRR